MIKEKDMKNLYKHRIIRSIKSIFSRKGKTRSN
jgi:hypothetical protein